MVDSQPIEEKTDEDLARNARSGSRRSFEELALRYRRRLFAYFRPRLGSDQDAEDLVQETFLKLYRNIGSYDPAFRFSTWLYTAANRLAISAFRKRKTAAAGMEAEVREEPAARAEEATTEKASIRLWDTAGTLGGNQFRALWLRYAEEMTIEEIAVSLGKSRLAVRLLLHRARANLMKREGEKQCSAG